MSEETVTPTVAGSLASGPRPTKPLGEVIHIDQKLVQQHLGEVVRPTVEETLNAMLDALEAFQRDPHFQLRTMLTPFLGNGDRSPEFGLTIRPVQLLGTTSPLHN